MKKRLIVFSGNKTFCVKDVEKILLKLGHFDFSYIICDSFEDFQGECKQDFETGIVLCENEKIDTLIENVKQEGDQLSLLHEQAITLQRGNKQILFLPLGVSPENFFKEFLNDRGALIYSVFGKSASFIQNIFDSIRCDYKIITKSPFLHVVYCSTSANPELLKSAFGENLFSVEDEPLALACAKKLEKSDQSIFIAEQMTAGLVCGVLKENLKNSSLVKKAVVLSQTEDFEKLGVSQEFMRENGIASKEMAFELAKNMALNSDSDLVMSVLGEGEKCFVALGNKQQIHVFSTLFEGESSRDFSNIVDFALFRLLRA